MMKVSSMRGLAKEAVIMTTTELTRPLYPDFDYPTRIKRDDGTVK